MDLVWIEDGIQWIKSLGIFTLGTATITGIIGYLFKTVFTQMLNKETELHKSILNQQTEHYKSMLNQQTEHYKAELQKMNNKHQITFSKLHADRAEVIKKMYSQLINLQLNTLELLGLQGMLYQSIDRSIDKTYRLDLIDKVENEAEELHNDFKINRIYFSERICNMFDNITIHILKATFHLRATSSYNQEEPIEHVLDLENGDRGVVDSILNEIPRLREALESEFRKLLGVVEE
ncbi:hypothetical protein [Bacillus mobilis]|uniref:hypothetical protein n=1 Tax=Bacillus mobilis TaxID=2026190 RepID=UPI0022E12A0D|nr:hypothetical protein [Bacillus mobilis]